MPSDATGRLLDSAVKAFARHGLEGARVSEIARQAGLTTGAIYARWPAKADLLAAAVDCALSQILPEHRLQNLDAAQMRSPDMTAMLGANLTANDEARDVMIRAVGDARHNDAIAASLARFLNDEAEQLSRIIEASKAAGLLDAELDTAAMTLLCQAVGIGTHLVLSAGLAERNVPTADKWGALLATLVGSMTTARARSPRDPDV